MKIDEKIHYDAVDDKYVIERKFDNNPAIEYAKANREKNGGKFGENRLIGTIPMHLVAEWLKEAGVDWTDRQAAQDVVKRKILSGEFDKLRVWKGTY